MHVSQVRVNGEDFVGLLGLASDRYAVLSPEFKDVGVLQVPVLRTRIYGTNLAGLFCAGNSNGILAPYFLSDTEMDALRSFASEVGAEVLKLEGKYTAIGNLVACNDKAAIVSTHIRDVKTLRDALDVEVVQMDVGAHSEVGAYVLPTNRGFLAHPDAEEQLDELKGILGVEGMVGTVNCGVPYVKSGVIANSRGYMTGQQTTGIELQRIDDALGFY